MSNMSYCKLENTYNDLLDCYQSLKNDDSLSETELEYRDKILDLCIDITNLNIFTDRDYISQMFADIRSAFTDFKKFKFDMLSYCEPDEENNIFFDVTIGYTKTEDGSYTWNYQTGDNSYTGGAYLHSNWLVTSVTAVTTLDQFIEDLENDYNTRG